MARATVISARWLVPGRVSIPNMYCIVMYRIDFTQQLANPLQTAVAEIVWLVHQG
jgi:hypothetical protein